jgi:serine/threonine-protein kinase RsbW/sigma-B regulation protein RsbU (phosphoserine phosphatase)
MSSTGKDKVFRAVIGNTIAEMQSVVDLVEQFATHHSLPQRLTNDLNICLDELIKNTISYGYEDDRKREIAVELSFDGTTVSAEIRDDGRPFDPRQAKPPPAGEGPRSRQIGGLGLHFVKSLMDEIHYMRLGDHNVVQIVKRSRA